MYSVRLYISCVHRKQFPPHGVCELAPNSSQFRILELWGWTCTGKRWTFCTTRPGELFKMGQMLSTQTALLRRFFTCFFWLDYLFGWWQLKHFFMFTPKIGEDEPNFDFRICFLDGLVKNPQRVVYVASVILETHQVGVNRRLRLKFRWISRRPGFRDDGNVRYFRVHASGFRYTAPHLGRFWMSFCLSIMLMVDVFVSSSLHADTFWVCWATLIFLQETGSWSRFSNNVKRYPPWKLTYPYISPENQLLEDVCPIEIVPFQGTR